MGDIPLQRYEGEVVLTSDQVEFPPPPAWLLSDDFRVIWSSEQGLEPQSLAEGGL